MFDLFLPCLLLGRRKLAAAERAEGRESERNITARGNGERTKGGRAVGHVNWREVKWLWQREERRGEEGREGGKPILFQGGIWGVCITRTAAASITERTQGGSDRTMTARRSEGTDGRRQQNRILGEKFTTFAVIVSLLLLLLSSPHGSTQQSLPAADRRTDGRTACSNSSCSFIHRPRVCVVVLSWGRSI